MVLYLDILTPGLIALIAGLVIHSFIIVVNINDWRKGRSVTPVDHIITSLGISRVCLQCAVLLYLYINLLLQESHAFSLNLYITRDIMDLISCFFSYSNFWLTSLLSIVFCLKISSLRTRLFLYLRRMIEQRIARFIIASVIISMFNCLLPLWVILSELIKGKTSNITMENQLLNCIYINYIYNYMIGPIIPLFFCCISSVVLFFSLYHHTRKMKMSGNLSINLETHYSAMKFISSTFVYNTLHFGGYFVNVLYYYLYCVELLWLYVVLECLPALHSSYLIYRTAKLRSQMSKVLQNIIGLLSQRKEPETRENIEAVAQ